ncbi:hypothetical protein GCM10027589_02740 [Actinocorallia lasiicapitis]
MRQRMQTLMRSAVVVPLLLLGSALPAAADDPEPVTGLNGEDCSEFDLNGEFVGCDVVDGGGEAILAIPLADPLTTGVILGGALAVVVVRRRSAQRT